MLLRSCQLQYLNLSSPSLAICPGFAVPMAPKRLPVASRSGTLKSHDPVHHMLIMNLLCSANSAYERARFLLILVFLDALEALYPVSVDLI